MEASVNTGALARLLEQATPGPWRWGTGDELTGDWPDYYLVTVEEFPTRSVGPLSKVVVSDDPPSQADATLIALAPDACRLLTDMAEELERVARGEFATKPAKALVARFAALEERAAQ